MIVDDEYLARQLLEGYVAKVPDLELVCVCESALQAIDALSNNKIDLLFLDVNMPELSGISFLKSLKHKPEVILTTAYSEHALDGYQLDVIEYLLKPIYFERFVQAVQKARDQIELKLRAGVIEDTTASVVEGDSFFVKTGPQKISRLKFSDILYVESLHEYVRIHLTKESHTIYSSLKSIVAILPGDQFIQIHRSYIVNFNRVNMIEGNTVQVDNVSLSIGKNFREEFVNKIKAMGLNLSGIKSSPSKQ
jgi:two-component system, LytTR family, response regulator